MDEKTKVSEIGIPGGEREVCEAGIMREERKGFKIRKADSSDAGALLGIYRPYVTDTPITFEFEPPSLEEFKNRMLQIMTRYPYLVAESDERIGGYCYASQFKNRDAYDWSVETTIYISPEFKGMGIGRKLYEKLEEILARQGILNLNACIAYPHQESVAFHEKMGFQTVAHFHKCGYKLGAWYDMVWMEKMIGEHRDQPKQITPALKITY